MPDNDKSRGTDESDAEETEGAPDEPTPPTQHGAGRIVALCVLALGVSVTMLRPVLLLADYATNSVFRLMTLVGGAAPAALMVAFVAKYWTSRQELSNRGALLGGVALLCFGLFGPLFFTVIQNEAHEAIKTRWEEDLAPLRQTSLLSFSPPSGEDLQGYFPAYDDRYCAVDRDLQPTDDCRPRISLRLGPPWAPLSFLSPRERFIDCKSRRITLGPWRAQSLPDSVDLHPMDPGVEDELWQDAVEECDRFTPLELVVGNGDGNPSATLMVHIDEKSSHADVAASIARLPTSSIEIHGALDDIGELQVLVPGEPDEVGPGIVLRQTRFGFSRPARAELPVAAPKGALSAKLRSGRHSSDQSFGMLDCQNLPDAPAAIVVAMDPEFPATRWEFRESRSIQAVSVWTPAADQSAPLMAICPAAGGETSTLEISERASRLPASTTLAFKLAPRAISVRRGSEELGQLSCATQLVPGVPFVYQLAAGGASAVHDWVVDGQIIPSASEWTDQGSDVAMSCWPEGATVRRSRVGTPALRCVNKTKPLIVVPCKTDCAVKNAMTERYRSAWGGVRKVCPR